MIYLPGTPASVLPDGFKGWSHISWDRRDVIPSGYYGIYNEAKEEGFISIWEV